MFLEVSVTKEEEQWNHLVAMVRRRCCTAVLSLTGLTKGRPKAFTFDEGQPKQSIF